MISIFVAVADNGVIGRDNDLIWHIPEDLKRFKALTMGKPCIMGRKTFGSIVARLGKPLPGRTSIVITRQPAATSPYGDNVILVNSFDAAVAATTAEEIMVIGGAQIYDVALPHADKIYLTQVHQAPEGDSYFPRLNQNEWTEISCEEHDGYDFVILERKS